MRSTIFFAALAFTLIAALPPSARAGNDGSDSTLRVLLVGNSYTRYHHLHRMLRRLSDHDAGGPRLVARRETRAGCTLRRHWVRREARDRIRSGRYSHVVLQGHSLRAIDRPEELSTYVRRFHDLIAGAGAKTVLYATWARQDGSGFYQEREELEGPPAMQRRIDGVYGTLAGDLEAELAPVGLAWLLAMRQNSDLALHGSDGAHPTIAGTYLTASVLYGTLTGRDPRQAEWAPHSLDAELARELRDVAAGVVGP